MTSHSDLIKQFHTTYTNLPRLNEIDADYKPCLIAKRFNLSHLKLITPNDVQGDGSYIASFIRHHGPSVMYPLSIGNSLLGFGFRAIKESQYNVLPLSPLYFYSASSLIQNGFAGFSFGVPLVFSEGLFDSEMVSLVYRFSFAYMTSGISDVLAQFISTITDKVILIPDNDKAGMFGFEKSEKLLHRYGIKTKSLFIDKKFKDPGVILEGLSQDTDIDFYVNAKNMVQLELNNLVRSFGYRI